MIIKGLQCFMNPHDDEKKKKYQREKVTILYKKIIKGILQETL